ncbi:hypothetical protein ACTI_66400 [Actinoplanes sp. OR16]|uniref:flavodoxin family protein n=1 Tax=Actinoplanes sp. OR16 TaxID=946334 RepID=UPI000F715805|nr:flavodoxin domain-containing protein [Actinoplanes sp. OR16]BBH69955.1 hypothetical protein ACTI_66400 [Actinoplanes sp. OR16]
MKALVVYESMFGNTEAVARALAEGLGESLDVIVADVQDRPAVGDADVLVAGAPTHAFSLSRPSTRADAAGKGELAAAETFAVGGVTGPLTDGEITRARRWGAELAAIARERQHVG